MKLTEDEVFEQNLSGLPEGYTLNPERRRKHTVIKPEETTVQISLKIEGDLLSKLKKSASEKGLGYQTLLKQLVRSGLEAEEKGVAQGVDATSALADFATIKAALAPSVEESMRTVMMEFVLGPQVKVGYAGTVSPKPSTARKLSKASRQERQS